MFYLTVRIDGHKWYRAALGGWTRRKDQAQVFDTTIEAAYARAAVVRIEDHEGEEPDRLALVVGLGAAEGESHATSQ
jgi:hypothetical protein